MFKRTTECLKTSGMDAVKNEVEIGFFQCYKYTNGVTINKNDNHFCYSES